MKNICYLVENNSVYDGQEDTHHTTVFLEHENAKKFFDKLVQETKDNDHLFDLDEEDLEIIDTEDEFTVFEQGNYSEDHISITLKTVNFDDFDKVNK